MIVFNEFPNNLTCYMTNDGKVSFCETQEFNMDKFLLVS
jgi:hypothetical protein